MQGFKGFDQKMQCKGKQYEVGKTYVHEGEVKLCEKGLHFCEHPLDVFGFYPPSESRFAEVEADEVSKETSKDTKRVCKKLMVKVELSIKSMVDAAIKFVFEKADWSKKETQATEYQGAASATGDWGAASATGYQGAASATGYQGAASATGDWGAASATEYQGAACVEGKESIACALGYDCKAKGVLGTWLVLTERNDNYEILSVKSVKVDGKKIKADTWYMLKNKKVVKS